MDEVVVEPTITYEYQDGIVIGEAWWWKDQRHRVDGPAWREWTLVEGVPMLTYEGS